MTAWGDAWRRVTWPAHRRLIVHLKVHAALCGWLPGPADRLPGVVRDRLGGGPRILSLRREHRRRGHERQSGRWRRGGGGRGRGSGGRRGGGGRGRGGGGGGAARVARACATSG